MSATLKAFYVACLVAAASDARADSVPQADIAGPGSAASYRVEVHVSRILASDNSTPSLQIEDQLRFDPLPEAGEHIGHAFGTEIRLRVHGESWVLNENGLARDGVTDESRALIQTVASPAILLPIGESAEIRIGDEGAQYFEADEDGAYSLHTLDEFVGYTFACTLTPSSAMEGALSMKIDSTLRESGAREPVSGLATLDVGKPNVRTQTFQTNIQLKPGDWLASVSRSDDGSILLTCVTVREQGS
ncbi:MAG: hypothetical protein AMXMBFR82_14280 [Candidatus Hydrogenedentota bacterium]